ncbi:MAG: hypothetical protein RLZZ350_440 [Verrucomicrobiota bacterium]|jgi:uncharacterized protein YgiM (DUF1202 family)
MKKTVSTLLTLVFAAAVAFADTQAGTNAPLFPVPPIVPPPHALGTPATTPIEVGFPRKEATPAAAPKHTVTPKKKIAAKSPALAAKKIVHAKPAVVHAKPAAPAFSVPLTPGTATVVAKHVNVRGKPTIHSEVLTRLNEGDTVTVIEEITRDNAKADEPSFWAKIAAPSTAHLWVNAQFVDTNKVVTVKKLNLRTGAGENYSVAGQLVKGNTVNELGSKNGWLEIAPAANSFAYVAAAYLKQGAPTTGGEIPTPAPGTTTPAGATNDWTTPTPEPAPTPTTVTGDTNMIATSTTDIATPANTGSELLPAAQAGVTNTTAVKPAKESLVPKIVVPVEPRIVQREGIVRRTFSIQAPTSFALASPDTGATINYLYTAVKTLNLARYKGMHIIVTGEEGLDERWRNTPVITIQKIQVIE